MTEEEYQDDLANELYDSRFEEEQEEYKNASKEYERQQFEPRE